MASASAQDFARPAQMLCVLPTLLLARIRPQLRRQPRIGQRMQADGVDIGGRSPEAAFHDATKLRARKIPARGVRIEAAQGERGLLFPAPKGPVDGAALKELVIPAVRDGGAFHLRPRLPERSAEGNPLHGDFGADLRTGVREARSAPATSRDRHDHASRRRGLSAGTGGRCPSSVRSRCYERPAGHPVLIGRTTRKTGAHTRATQST